MVLYCLFVLRWTENLVQEFFEQGDKEREMNLPLSPLCDRHSTMIAQSQIGKSILRIATYKKTCMKHVAKDVTTNNFMLFLIKVSLIMSFDRRLTS